jgi:integrase
VDDEGRPLASPHALRHTAASIMLVAGVPLLVVSRQLGYANPNITARVSAHLIADEQLDVAAALFATRPKRPRARERAPERKEQRP